MDSFIMYNIKSCNLILISSFINQECSRNFHSLSDRSATEAEITDYLQRRYEKSSSVTLEILFDDPTPL